MSSRRVRSPGSGRGPASARDSARGYARGSRRQQAQTSEDEEDRVPIRQMIVRRKIKTIIDRMSHSNLINSVGYLASVDLNPLESSTALLRLLDVARGVGDQYEEMMKEQEAEIRELRAKVIELEKDSDDRTVILDDDQDRVFAPSIRLREGDTASGRGSARGGVTLPPRAPVRVNVQPVLETPPLSAPVASMPEPGTLPYPAGTRLPERGPPKQYTVLILHYLAAAVPMEAVLGWCRSEQNLLKEWVVGIDEGRGEVLAAVRYIGRKMAVGTYTFRIGTEMPTTVVVPPPRQQAEAMNYVRGLADAVRWGTLGGAADISDVEDD